MRAVLALGMLASAMGADLDTCGALKDFYKAQSCCKNPTKAVQVCPYSFKKPACKDAEPQAPRDLSQGATGERTPKAATLNAAQAKMLPLANVHFHLGAEHKSDNYKDDTDSKAYDASHKSRRLGANPRPGWMCANGQLNSDQLKEYTFEHCKGDVKVGKTYEIHYVHSSAGYHKADIANAPADQMADGLGGAANGRGLLNPMVVVQGQVFHIVQGAAKVDDLLHGWTVVDHKDSVMYSGSTTGPSHTNEVCSPYVITWHVDKACHQVSPESFDKLCKDMKSMYGLENDLKPHGSRILLDKAHVVKNEYVVALA